MDILSVSTNFDYGNTDNNFNVRKKIDGRKELKLQLKTSLKRNEELENNLQQNQIEIADLKKQIDELNLKINSKILDEKTVTSSKIIELSRKNRQLKAELELTKSKYNKIDSKLEKLEKEINGKELNKQQNQQPNGKKIACCHQSVNIDHLHDQLAAAKHKLFETLNLNTELKNNLKLAQKCIQQEIGENFNLQSLASNQNSNWRGRAQQIITMQQKITELKERLEGNSSPTNYHDDVKHQNRKYKLEIDELNTNIQTLNSIIDEQKTKISALKVRNKNLQDEATNYKMKTLNLMEQSDQNDTSIANSNEKLNVQKYFYENKMKDLQKEIENFEHIRKDFEIENSRTQLKLDAAEDMVKEKQKSIEDLYDIIGKLEVNLKDVCGDYLFACRDLKKNEFLAILDSLESEKNGLIKLNDDINKRLYDEKEKNRLLNEQISKFKVKVSRLEAKIRDHKKDLDKQQEKFKRTKLVQDYVNNRLTTPTIIFENSNLTNGETICSPTTSKTSIQEESSNPNSALDDLNNQIELLSEKNDYTEEKLRIVSMEKENDLKLFNEIMTNSKEILLNMINKSKSTVTQNCEEEFHLDNLSIVSSNK